MSDLIPVTCPSQCVCIAVVVAVLCGADCKAQSATADGLFRHTGNHIRLVTDIDDASQMDTIVATFDAAVPQWVSFWRLEPDAADDWVVDAYVMRNDQPFRDKGLLPRSLAEFPYGIADGNRVWVREQADDYYTRHLVLHEGVHALMYEQFGGAGPTWFMEGTAELLSVHSGVGSGVVIGQVPRNRESVPGWGRFKILSQRRDDGEVKTIEDVMRLPHRLRGDVESYGWSWAAVMMLAQYAEYRDALVDAATRDGRDQSNDFTRRLYAKLVRQWPVVRARWALMNLELDYGFRWDRESIDIAVDDPLYDGSEIQTTLHADRGWQSTGYRFPASSVVRIAAQGDVVLADTTRPWVALPDGITMRHVRGRPLGQVIACLVPTDIRDTGSATLPTIVTVGDDATIRMDRASWLFLRVNDSVDQLTDNQGHFEIRITPAR